MPDLATRRERERAIAVLMLILFDEDEDNILGGGRFNPSQFIGRASAALEPPLRNVYREAGEGLLNRFKVQRILDTSATRWANRYSKNLATELARTTRNRLAELDPDTPEFQAELAAIFDADRAASIGITETTRAITTGEGDAAAIIREETGRKLTPTWITEEDERVCQICEPLNQTTPRVWRRVVPQGPPAHPRCRCYLEYT